MSDYESWLVKREEKAERKNAVFWLIFSIIIIGIAMWCFVDTIREYQFSEKLLREGTCITAEYYEGHNAYQYFEAGKSRFAVCKKSIIYKDQGDTVKMYYTGDDFSQAVPLLADWVWITQFGIEIAVMGAGLIGVIRQGKRIHRNNLRKLPVVFSTEQADPKAVLLTEDEQNKKSTCGTVSYMPAVFGCYLAEYVIKRL